MATTAVSDSAAGGAGVGQMAEPATDTMTAEDEAEAADAYADEDVLADEAAG